MTISESDAAARPSAGHEGRAYEITGPEQLTQRRQVEIIAEVVGRPVDVRRQGAAEAEEEMSASLGPEYAAAALAYWGTLEKAPERATTDVEQVTGQVARTFATWARDHAHDFQALDTAEVARRYADGFRSGDLASATALLSPEVVRVAPSETDGKEVEVRGLVAIAHNASAQNEGVELESVDVSEPMVGTDTVAIRFRFDERILGSGALQHTTKISMCTVDAGRIVREDVFYYTPRPPRRAGEVEGP